jgi:hypothetical protein
MYIYVVLILQTLPYSKYSTTRFAFQHVSFHTIAVKCDNFSDSSVLRVSCSVRLLPTTDRVSVSITELHSYLRRWL